jgi:hypothetical protein
VECVSSMCNSKEVVGLFDLVIAACVHFTVESYSVENN